MHAVTRIGPSQLLHPIFKDLVRHQDAGTTAAGHGARVVLPYRIVLKEPPGHYLVQLAILNPFYRHGKPRSVRVCPGG